MNQINTKVGSLDINSEKIIKKISEAKSKECDIICFPELSVTGYPPEDLVLSDKFIENNKKAVNQIINHTKNITAIVGFIDKDKFGTYNAAAIISRKKLLAIYRKNKLPNYGVFDEKRYFTRGKELVVLNNKDIKIGISICEDIWDDFEICKLQSKLNCNLLLNINGSPYDLNKKELRKTHLSKVAKECNSHLIYINSVGGQDELIFDGSSMVINNKGKIISYLPSFQEKDEIIDLEISKKINNIEKSENHIYTIIEKDIKINNHNEIKSLGEIKESNELDDILNALILGTKDYAWKNGFEKCLVSLSGGIDSALVTYIAVMAVGKENVKVVTLPSKYSSSHSIIDSEGLCNNLGIELINIPIKDSHDSILGTLKNIFQGTKVNNAEENLQSRIRGNLIMAISNKFSWLVLSTGNKSEMATGYATLYGDMAGGFSVLKDVPKTLVYKLANHINETSDLEIIPKNILIKPPSAELRPNQFDNDTLPDYGILDKIIEKYIEQKQSIEEILNSSDVTSIMSEERIIEILRMIDRNEYKRRQSPPGVKITPLAFGRDRRYPISSDYEFSYKNFTDS